MQELAFNRNRLGRNTTVLPTAHPADNYQKKKLGRHGEYDLFLLTRSSFYPKVAAYKGTELAGNITMGVTPGQVSSVIVWPEHKGQGIGVALYEAALKHYKTLRSSIDLSIGSAMLWKTMVEKHHGKLVVPLIDTKEFLIKELISVDIVGWRQSGKFWWPVVKKSGQSVSLADLLKSVNTDERRSAEESYYEVKK